MAKTLAMIFGVVFVLVGLLGFVNNPILGLFAVDVLHNIVHILLGIILIAGARSMNPMSASKSMKTVGIIYIVLAVLGFIIIPAGTTDKLLGIVTMNGADNWLHAVLGVVLLIAAMSGGKGAMKSNSMPSGSQM